MAILSYQILVKSLIVRNDVKDAINGILINSGY